jgi:hypothetical protein
MGCGHGAQDVIVTYGYGGKVWMVGRAMTVRQQPVSDEQLAEILADPTAKAGLLKMLA